MLTVNSFLLLLFLFFTNSLAKNKFIQFFISFIFSLFILTQAASLYITKSFFNYQFYIHTNFQSLFTKGNTLTKELLFAAALFSLTLILLSFFSQYLKKINPTYRCLISLASIIFLFLIPHSPIKELHEIYQIVNAQKKSFNDALKNLGIPPSDYVLPKDLKASKGLNIIVISVESLEIGFLDRFPLLTPRLNSLRAKWSFYPQLEIGPGGGWTAGSLYKQQVGIPAFFKGGGNDFFQGAKNAKLTGVGNVLKTAGYDARYIMGLPEYAGMKDLLETYEFTVISEKNSIQKYSSAPWGLFDFDLIEEAKEQISDIFKTTSPSRPFALFLSTVGSHFPNGILDKRMKKKFPELEGLQLSIRTVDFIIGEFIDHLEKRGLLKNTAVYIFPDHNMMGSSGEVISRLEEEPRHGFLLTNTKPVDLRKKIDEKLFQIDLPKLILNGAKIETNAKFLKDYIREDVDVLTFLEKNKSRISSLNTASVLRQQFNKDISIKITEEGVLVFRSGSERITHKLKANQPAEIIDLTFNSNMVFIEKYIITEDKSSTPQSDDVLHKRLHLIAFIKSGKIQKIYIGNKDLVGVFKNGQNLLFSTKEIEGIVKSNSLSFQSTMHSEQITKIDSSLISLISSEYITSSRIPSFIQTEKQRFKLTRGLNLLTTDNGIFFRLENFDSYIGPQELIDFIKRFSEVKSKGGFWAIVLHDALKNPSVERQNQLATLGLPLLSKTFGRVAYISYSRSDGVVVEDSSKKSLKYTIPAFSRHLSKKEAASFRKKRAQNTKAAQIWAQKKSRFIAHAGGAIEHHKYTNSLEALNTNYKKGFRVFELDIVKTKDGKYVAAHDWTFWKKNTNYSGEIPPLLSDFKSEKIFNKYTALGMKEINRWFISHPDSFLVTDKVNEPLSFSEKFIPKKRLRMELFTMDAVKEAVKININTTPNWSVLAQIQGNKLDFLRRNNIKSLSASIRILPSEEKLARELTKGNIKIYAYHINHNKFRDETFVACNAREFFYGLYADKWNFQKKIDCSL